MQESDFVTLAYKVKDDNPNVTSASVLGKMMYALTQMAMDNIEKHAIMVTGRLARIAKDAGVELTPTDDENGGH